jgi:predicted MPP superfamily phosphohydrolase
MTVIALPGARVAAEALSVVIPESGGVRAAWLAQRQAIEARKLASDPDGWHARWGSTLFAAAVHAFAWSLRPLGLYARGRANALAPQLVERSFFFADLPAVFDGYRILQISDSHLDCLPELAGIARQLVSGLTVDLAVITGDIQGAAGTPVVRAALPLANVLAGAKVRDRTLAVLGNHDPALMVEALEHVGIATLVNESLAIERGGERLVVTGLDDVHRFYTPAAKEALTAAPHGFRIALVHSPEIADHAAAAGYRLYLCGHTHGGQICLPTGRAIFTQLRRCRFGAQGEWRAGAMIGYTSNGLGVGEVPLRFNCRGEVAVITLRRGAAGD